MSALAALATTLWVQAPTATTQPASTFDDVAVIGLVLSPDAARSSAVLRVAERTRVVAVGDLVRGARVAAIAPATVVLEEDGRRHELRLRAPGAPALAAPASAAPAPAESDGREFARADLERRIAEETPRLLGETALIPVNEGGQVTGFTLSRLPDNSLLTDLGLQAGDVLTEINGTPIDSMATLLALYARLRGESEIRATLLRGGSAIPLVVRLR